MSVFCETLMALNMTFGVFCQPSTEGKVIALPEDDRAVWAISSPPPPPKKAPTFPPIIIQPAPLSAPPPVQPPAPAPIVVAPVVEKKPPQPNPYRIALSAALRVSNDFSDMSVSVSPFTAEDLSSEPVPITAPASGPLDLPPPNTQDSYESDGVTSGLPVDNSRILTADRYISGILETGFNSQLDSAAGGEVIIQTSRDVFGYHGRDILIPKGSRLICSYNSPGKQGVSRIGFSCKRILLAGHRAEIRQLVATVGDVQGRGGVTGEVDNRFWEKYGTAIIMATISSAVRLATAASASKNETSSLGTTLDKGSEELSQKFGEISAQITEQTVNLAQIITVSQGTRVQIRPAKDWYIQKIGEAQ